MEKIFTTEEARGYLKISNSTILRYIKSGKLKTYKLGRQHRITETTIRNFDKMKEKCKMKKIHKMKMGDKLMNDILKVQGRMTKGYGIIPKMVMQDKRLTIEAKSIYAYFCSYAGAVTTAFPSRDKIVYDLQLGVKRYYSHFNLLKEYGYIEVEQKVDNNGKFKSNIYTLVEMIEDHSEPCSQNDHTEKPCGRFAYTVTSHTQNDHTNNNSIKINTLNNQQVKVKSKSD